MLSAFTNEWDGTKYQYYRYIPYLFIDKPFVRMVYHFWDRLESGRGGAKKFTGFARKKILET